MSKSKCDKLLAEKFIQELEIFLKNNEPEKALELFISEKYAAVIPDSSWDVIPLVSSYLTMTNKLNEQPLFNCCIRILDIVAEKCCPSETVLEFLEQVECDDYDVKFSVLLKPLGTSLTRMDDKTKAIEWCISTIRAYTDGLPLPYTETENNIQDKPHIDADVMSRRIMKVYRNILNFLEPLVNEASLEKGITSKSRNYLLSLLLSLLGKPFCYISTELVDLESILTGGGRSIAEMIVTYITYLTGDSFRFLKILDDRCNQRNRKLIGDSDKHESHGNSEVNLFASEENVSDLAYAQFYYLLMELESLQNKLPRVYHPHYLIHTCFYLAKCLLQKSKDTLIRKGLRLIQILLKHVDKFSVGPDALELSVHSELFGTITKIMVYCESEKERHTALQVFEDYLKIFNLQARYLVILHLYETSNHTGLISIITNAFKSSIVMCLNENPHNPCFLGKKMKTLLSRACRLSHGSATDLIEISDEVITALNLLRFLTIRDKENATGIWDYIEKLQTDYLNPLRKGIDLAHAHWKYKIKDLELQKKKSSKNLNTTLPHNAKQTNELDDSVTITVGGENLPVMPISEKIRFCEQAMNALDVMESILIRVNECIAENSSTY
ncbi:glomulin isoform X2 [Cephus cinctus]|nr:glomulin isoform X2 [Cephus cinctus]